MNNFVFGSLIVLFFLMDFGIRTFVFFKSFRWINPKTPLPGNQLLAISLLMVLAPNVIVLAVLPFVPFNFRTIVAGILVLLMFPLGCLILKKSGNISLGRSLGTLGLYLVLLFPLNLVARFCVKTYYIPAGSMENTLSPDDYVLSNNIIYGHSFFNKTPRYLVSRMPRKGELVVFRFPPDTSKDFVKRCIGVPGDVVEIKNEQLYVDGVRQAEPYVKHTMTPDQVKAQFGPADVRDNFGPVTVQDGHYFMLGDNRENSYDSRYWGQLDEKLILGKVIGIYWRGQEHRFLLQVFP